MNFLKKNFVKMSFIKINKIKIISLALLIGIISGTMLLEGCSTKKAEGEELSEAHNHKDLYYCPMHPNVTSDKPGVCPICHMDLVKKADDATMNDMSNMLEISKRGQVLANVATVKVVSGNISKDVTAFGYLDFTEPGRKMITARFSGRIEKLFVDASGKNIQKGQALFEIYSPDLVQAQNEYLIAIRSTKNQAYASANNSIERNDNSLMLSSRRKLELFGLTQKQIKEIEQSGEVKLTMTYYSPYSGTVIEKKVQEGMYVQEGSPVYDIAEMSTLWNVSELYADDITAVKVGDQIKMHTSAYPGEEFAGRVTFIYPVVNSDTRTIKVRSEVKNPQGKLKPQMYTETVFSKNYGKGLLVPESAVLFTGKRNIVWVKTSEGMFEPRDVTVGVKTNGSYQILSGLKEGEEAASSGSYLIDSESQLQSGNSAGGHQHGGSGAAPQNNNQQNNNQQNNGQQNNSQQNNHEGHNAQQQPLQGKQHQGHSQAVPAEKPKSATAGIWNAYCPVLGSKVNPAIKTVQYKGKTIGFCCGGCDKEFIANPEKYLQNLSSDGKTFIAKK
ncbi:MAG: efflux RND transporter periplasmic adaptor subunit [Bacillota bacterium]